MRNLLILLGICCILACTDTDTEYVVQYSDREIKTCPSFVTGLSVPQYFNINEIQSMYIYLCNADTTYYFTNGEIVFSQLPSYVDEKHYVTFLDVTYTCVCGEWTDSYDFLDAMIELNQYISVSECTSSTAYLNFNGVCIYE